MDEKDLNTIPMDELTQMVSWMTVWDAENLSKGQPEAKKEEPKEEVQEAQDKEPESTPEAQEPEKESKKTPDSIKKLLHQRSELRQNVDRLENELKDANETIRKLRSWELDAEFKNSEGEVDLEKKEEAIQDASFNRKLIERELSNSNRDINSTRDWELNKFFAENPDLTDVKEDIVEYANAHKDLDIEDIKYLVLSKIDPTRLLDEQTKHKLKWGYDIAWTDYQWPKQEDKKVADMSSAELLSIIKEKGLL